MHQNPLSAGAPPRTPLGERTTLPQTPESAAEGIPLPYSPPPRRLRRLELGAYGASILSPLPYTISWLRHCAGDISFSKDG